MTAGSDDKQLRLEIDSASRRAGMGLASALTPALVEAGMSTTITFDHFGDHAIVEKRSRDEALRLAAEASRAVVYQLRIYLPPAAIALGLEKLVERIDAAIRKWRRDTGNPDLTVPIYGPDGETIIHTVTKEPR